MHLSILLTLLPALVYGHMQLISPFALNQQENPNARSGKIDYDYSAPLDKSGSNYPCRGHLSALGGAAGASVATWRAGSTQSFTVKGGASHMGGSCQASLSEDSGKSFRVMKSYVGGCPVPNKAFTFTVPKGAKSGPAVFAWTWFNNQGNREMYMNCASVTITDGGSGMGAPYPDIFRANIGNGCTTQEGTDVVFPNPGNDVEKSSTKTAPPIGNCGPAGPPKSVGTATPSSVPTPKKGCSCVCGGYTFQFSPDEV
ncbi:Lytic polysaccharide monooxygenase [Tuber magnatum]|uniref:Lytic polysaccharide monooxygenase n=1 Tax=Tuber magnatum TaxID=42249 RepID=A0A317SX01_9PEZI|nr:Lytic polysaccharide monooxygenase [Tuber magnatum]